MTDDPVAAPFENYLHRALAAGAHYNDLVEIRKRIARIEDWREAWRRQAGESARRGAEALGKGDRLTGAADLARAATLFHFGQAFQFHDPAAKAATHKEAVAAFAAAAPHLDPPLRRVEIPFGSTTLPGYLRLPRDVAKSPCVVLVGGLDSTKEEQFAFTTVCAERGLATLSFEGPGQGEAFHAMKLDPDLFVEAGIAVFDFASGLPEIDPARLGIMGRSMGGHFAPRIAAQEKRARALAVWGAMYHLRRPGDLPLQARNGFRHATGLTDDDALAKFYARMDLDGIATKIDQPTLIVHSGRDAITPEEHMTLLAGAVSGPVETLFFAECRHCAFEMAHVVIPAQADFFRRELKAG